jgi:hypothetical protein
MTLNGGSQDMENKPAIIFVKNNNHVNRHKGYKAEKVTVQSLSQSKQPHPTVQEEKGR